MKKHGYWYVLPLLLRSQHIITCNSMTNGIFLFLTLDLLCARFVLRQFFQRNLYSRATNWCISDHLETTLNLVNSDPTKALLLDCFWFIWKYMRVLQCEHRSNAIKINKNVLKFNFFFLTKRTFWDFMTMGVLFGP